MSGIGGATRIAWIESVLRKAAALPEALPAAISGLRAPPDAASFGFGCQEESFWGGSLPSTSYDDAEHAAEHCALRAPVARRAGARRGTADFGLAMSQGRRHDMEDMAIVERHVRVAVDGQPGTPPLDVSFFAVVDGHGGIEAAAWADRFLFQNVRAELAAVRAPAAPCPRAPAPPPRCAPRAHRALRARRAPRRWRRCVSRT